MIVGAVGFEWQRAIRLTWSGRKTQNPSISGKRETIEPHSGDKRYVWRNVEGQFSESDDMDKSLAADRRQSSKTRAPKGQGDKGATK